MKALPTVFILSAFFSMRMYAQSADVSKLEPLNELGKDKYMGYVGGLYPDGSNTMPPSFYADAIAAASAIQPLNSQGNPSENGKIGLITIGPSTVYMFSQALATQITRVPGINPKLVFINGGVPAQDLNKIYDQQAKYWQTVESRVAEAGLSNAQIQVAWLQEDDLRNQTAEFPERADMLVDEFTYLVQKLKERYPNLQIIYLTGRHTTDYMPKDSKVKHMEPRAYLNGWAMKWLIEAQIDGNKELTYKGNDPKAPLLMWGPYFWTQGSKTRDDGYSFTPSMVNTDGVHPNDAGKTKVANDFLSFWETDAVSQIWFYGTAAAPPALAYYRINIGDSVIAEFEESSIAGNLNVLILRDSVIAFDQAYDHENLDIYVNNLGAGSWKFLITDNSGVKMSGEFVTDAKGNIMGATFAGTLATDDADAPAWIVNGRDRMPKLLKFLGDDRYIKMEIIDHNKKVILTMEDIMHKHTDLNELVTPGKYCIRFYEQSGELIDTSRIIPEMVKIRS